MAGVMAVALAGQQSAQQSAQQQAIPDAPSAAPSPIFSGITPGKGTVPDAPKPANENQVPQAAKPATPDDNPGPPPDLPAAGEAPAYVLHQNVNFVQVPFTVKDKKGNLVYGLDWRDIRVYENNLRQDIKMFVVDPFPLSIALVIDQSLPYNVMEKVNSSLGALPGAFTPQDEVAVFTYNNGTKKQTDFTGSQSARLPAILERSKSKGREVDLYDNSGPLAQTTTINGRQFDPNTSPRRNQQGMTLTIPKEQHTLNDAIFAAAEELSTRPKERHRVIYVISDGKEYGSHAKFAEVRRYLQTNQISVWGTLVGDSAAWGLGWVEKFHLPMMMQDNILPKYVNATGGTLYSEWRQRAIEDSFAEIGRTMRAQYTIGYYSHNPFVDGKYRSIDVRVLRPNLSITAKEGYIPSLRDVRETSPTRVR
jgi:VWFA-related protein